MAHDILKVKLKFSSLPEDNAIHIDVVQTLKFREITWGSGYTTDSNSIAQGPNVYTPRYPDDGVQITKGNSHLGFRPSKLG